jgi:hypothetical protein
MVDETNDLLRYLVDQLKATNEGVKILNGNLAMLSHRIQALEERLIPSFSGKSLDSARTSPLKLISTQRPREVSKSHTESKLSLENLSGCNGDISMCTTPPRSLKENLDKSSNYDGLKCDQTLRIQSTIQHGILQAKSTGVHGRHYGVRGSHELQELIVRAAAPLEIPKRPGRTDSRGLPAMQESDKEICGYNNCAYDEAWFDEQMKDAITIEFNHSPTSFVSLSAPAVAYEEDNEY